MTAILIRFWPVLIPLVIYIIWHDSQRRKALKAGETPKRMKEGPWQLMLLSTVVLAVGCMVWFLLTTESHTNMAYQPAQIIDGKLVHGTMTEKPEKE